MSYSCSTTLPSATSSEWTYRLWVVSSSVISPGPTLDEADAHPARPVIEFFIAFGGRADVYVVNAELNIRVHLLQQHSVLDCVHAAEIGALWVEALVA